MQFDAVEQFLLVRCANLRPMTNHEFSPGDYLLFQLESGYGLLRLLDIGESADGIVWHLSAFNDYFLDPEDAIAAIDGARLSLSHPHLALTNRAFESTQVSKIHAGELSAAESAPVAEWMKKDDREISDKSIRLLLGLR